MKKLILSLLIIPLIFSSCSSSKMMVEYDPSIDFTQYKTFTFLPWNRQSDEILSELDKRRFHEAITYEMTQLGYERNDKDADLSINVFLIIDQKTGTSMYTDYYTSGIGTGYYYGPWGYNNPGGVSAYTTMHSYDYKEGTLVLDILDVKKKQLAWQGIAQQTIDSNPRSVDQGIKMVISKLFSKFPVEKEKK